MGIEQGLISKPASKYTNTTFNRGFIKNQLKQQMNQSLLIEAAKKAPDMKAITKQLDEMDIHGGVKRELSTQVNQALGEYSKSYAENPFNAFTKENRKLLSDVSSLINNPNVAQWEQQKALDLKELDKASTNETLDNIQIDGNRIKVVEKETGRFNWISIDAFRKYRDAYVPLTVREDYQKTTNSGSKNAKPFYSAMTGYNDVLKKANLIFDKVGSSTNTTFEQDGNALLTLTNSSNESQIEQAVSFLINNGFTENDINTLVSKEYSANPNQSYAQARLKGIWSLKELADSKITDSENIKSSKNPNGSSTTGDGAGGDGITQPVEVTQANRLFFGDEQNATWTLKGGTKDMTDSTVNQMFTTGKSLDGMILKGIGSSTFKDDDGNVVANRSVMENAGFRNVITTGEQNNTIKYLNEQGELVNAPKTLFRNAAILSDGEDSPMIINYLINPQTGEMGSMDDMRIFTNYQKALAKYEEDVVNNKKPTPPPELVKYGKPGENNAGEDGYSYNLMPTLAFTAMIVADDGGLSDDIKDQLIDDGITRVGSWAMSGNVNDDIKDATYKYLEKYTQLKPEDGWNDDIMLPRILVPIPDYESFAIDFGATTYTGKSSFPTASGKSYGGSSIFITDGENPNKNTISNQVKDRGLTNFDDK